MHPENNPSLSLVPHSHALNAPRKEIEKNEIHPLIYWISLYIMLDVYITYIVCVCVCTVVYNIATYIHMAMAYVRKIVDLICLFCWCKRPRLDPKTKRWRWGPRQRTNQFTRHVFLRSLNLNQIWAAKQANWTDCSYIVPNKSKTNI